MTKQTTNFSFPGQQTETITLYIKLNKDEHFIQDCLPLFNDENELENKKLCIK